jgi:AraC-like DNA-binding protein
MGCDCKPEWSRFYRLSAFGSVEALHARFVTHQYARHTHEYFVIGLVDVGAQSYWYRGARHTTPAGQVFLVNPDEPHTGESVTADGYVYRTLYPRIEDVARVARDMSNHAAAPYFKGAVLNDPLLVGLLSRFHVSISQGGSRAQGELLFLAAMARLITAHADPQASIRTVGRERPAIKRAREYMDSNFASDVSLSELAQLVSLSPYYFARTFEKEVGLPPHAYLEGVRIRKARELLDRGESLVSTALAVGYADQSHLTHRFRRILGITPGKYIREQDSTRRAVQKTGRLV